MHICVFGLWHLGTVTCACMAHLGHQVVGLDFDKDVIRRLSDGLSPIYEP